MQIGNVLMLADKFLSPLHIAERTAIAADGGFFVAVALLPIEFRVAGLR